MAIAPTSDIAGTGWNPSSAGAGLYTMVDEAAADDADYVVSPVPSQELVFGIAPQPAGNYTKTLRLAVSHGSAVVTYSLLDAGGAQVGAAAPVTITTTPTTYTLELTTTGTAARERLVVATGLPAGYLSLDGGVLSLDGGILGLT